MHARLHPHMLGMRRGGCITVRVTGTLALFNNASQAVHKLTCMPLKALSA
jgi:hypothetical protein